jgi:ketosteroid isomerase-like protein
MIDVKEIGLAFMNALWAGDVDTCHAMMSDDALWHFQLGMTQAKLGRGHVWPAREALQRIIDDLFGKFDESGFSVEASRVIADVASVAIEYEANGRTSKGDVYRNFYCTTLTVTDGKVTEVRPYNDTAHMLSLLS